MQVKHGKFYADWYDSQGRRHRAAFPSRREAEEHQNRMRAAIRNPQQLPVGRLRERQRTSSKRKGTTATSPHRSARSSRRSATKTRANSRPRKSSRSSTSGATPTRRRTPSPTTASVSAVS